MKRKAKFRVGQVVWCKHCDRPAKITGRMGGRFILACKNAGGGVLPDYMRPLTRTECGKGAP
jgi:hypothetical protein